MPQAQDNARFIFIIMLILWLNGGSDNGAGLLSAPSLIAGRLQRQRAAYTTMSNSHWGDFAPGKTGDKSDKSDKGDKSGEDEDEDETRPGRYLNLTGFREEDGLAWDDLEVFRQRCLEWSHNAYPTVRGQNLWDVDAVLPTWQNATGSVHGPWVRQACSVRREATSYNATALDALQEWPRGASGDGSGVADNNTGGGSEEDAGGSAAAAAGYGIRHSSGGGGNSSSAADNDDDDVLHDARGGRRHVAEWGRNITGRTGTMLVRVSDQEDETSSDELLKWPSSSSSSAAMTRLARAVTATVSLEDVEGTGSLYDMRLHGVHWPGKGALLLTTTSDKFAGIFGLPHLAPHEDFFQSSKRLLNRTLDAALAERENVHVFTAADMSYATPLWTSNVDGAPEGHYPPPRCEYVMYAQIHPVDATRFLPDRLVGRAEAEADDRDDIDGRDRDNRYETEDWARRYDPQNQGAAAAAAAMGDIERELRFPSGAPVPGGGGVPELQMSAVLYSPDCGYFLETQGPPRYTAAEGRHLRGLKAEMFVYEARMWMLAFAAVLGAQVKLLLGQVRETYTPSTLGRVSFYTAAMMLLADGLVFAVASAWTLTASASFLPSLVVTFVGFLSIAIGGGFLSEVYNAQEPERRRRERRQQQERQERQERQQQRQQQQRQQQQRQQRQQQEQPIIVPSDQDVDAEIAENAASANRRTPDSLLPLPVTASTTAANTGTTTNAQTTTAAIPTPSIPFSGIAGRMVMLGVLLLFLSLAASTWWLAVRTAYINMLAFVYLSLWVPQILRNIERNSRRAFAWRFMVGQSVLRLLPLAYFYLRADNILFAQTDPRTFTVLAAWLWLQLWVLAFQDVLGPRFGVPQGWAPEAWEYHPVLREDNVEAGGMPIGLVSTASAGAGAGADEDEGSSPISSPRTPRRRFSSSGARPGSSSRGDPAAALGSTSGTSGTAAPSVANTNIWTMDCPICCESLDVPVVRAGVDDPTAGGVAGVLARRQYMVTPCRHIFHTACLEGWLRFRLQCPICREELPPL